MKDKIHLISKWQVLLLLLVFSILLATGGYIYYQYSLYRILTEKGDELKVISQLKADQIEQWVKERMSETEYFSTTSEIVNNIRDLKNDKFNQSAINHLLSSLSSIKKNHGYDEIFIFLNTKELLFSLNGENKLIDSTLENRIDSSIVQNKAAFNDFYYCKVHKKIHLDLIAPVKSSGDNVPIAYLVMRIDPNNFLFPLIESWPIPSKTSEMLIFRKEANSVLFLNQLRHKENRNLTIRVPYTNTEVVAVKIALGQYGLTEGDDYQGVAVVAYSIPITGTPWIMVAKTDKHEIFADLNFKGIVITLIVLLLILLFGASLAWFYNHKQKSVYMKLFLSEKELLEKEEEFRTTLYSIGDGVITADAYGNIRRLNFVAEELTGWKEYDAFGKKLTEVFRIINEDTRNEVENPVEKVLRNGLIVGLANHTLLISKEGKETPIADSGALIKDKSGKIIGVVLVFRDQTIERLAETKLRDSEYHYRLLFESNPQPMWVYDTGTLKFLAVNDFAISKYGYTREQFLSMNLYDIRPREEFTKIQNNILQEKGVIQKSGVWKHQLRDGTIILVEIYSHSIIFNHSEARLVFAYDVTERLEMEEALKEREKLLTETGKIAKVGGWEFDAVTFEGTWTEEIAHIYDLDTGKKTNVEIALNFYTSDSKKKIQYAINEAIKHQVPYDIELEMVTQKNNHKWVRTIGQPIVEDGKVVRVRGAFQDITESVKMKRELADSEERYRSIFNNLHTTMLLLDPHDGAIIDANPAACNFYGFGYEELIHKNISEINLTTNEELLKAFEQSDASQKQFFSKHRLADGQVRDVEIFSGNIVVQQKDLLYSLIHDITERKKAEKELKKLSLAVEHSPASIVITDAKGNIEYVNPIFCEITGYSSEEVIGINPRILKSGKMSAELYQNLWNKIQSGQTWRGELLNTNKFGEFYWVNISISSIIDQKGQIANFVAVAEDITAKKKVDEELVKAKVKAEENDRLKSAFLANMSHEIRTPMNGILGFAELLRDTKLTGEDQQEYIGIIELSGHRMLNIINDIVDISKIEAGQMETKMEEIELNALLNHLYIFFKPEAEKKRLKLTLSLDPSVAEPIIMSDRTKLAQVITNLIKNAIKFTVSGVIQFGYVLKDKKIEFFVKDTGTGIPPEHHSKIFERFIQGDTSLSRNYEGAGLGLSISQAYVSMLGGRMWLESEVGSGSAFFFDIPANSVATVKEKRKNITAVKKTTAPISILIAEDDNVSLLYLKKCLESLNVIFHYARNGQEAVDAVKSIPNLELVIMDIKMPVMGGFEATRLIKQFRADLPVIAQTAYAFTEDVRMAKLAGCDDFIAKPVIKEKLIEMIYKFIQK